MDIVTIGQRIRSARKMRGMNADELAVKIGIAVESLGHIAYGFQYELPGIRHN